LLAASDECCTTWPRAGTWDGGFACEQPTSALPTFASGSSSSLDALLPTPKSSDGTRGGQYRSPEAEGGPHLAEALRLLPTPTVNDSRNGRNATANRTPGSRYHAGTTLSDVAFAGTFTNPPSDDGNGCSAEPHPNQLTIGDG